jgi:hypothetical protein
VNGWLEKGKRVLTSIHVSLLLILLLILLTFIGSSINNGANNDIGWLIHDGNLFFHHGLHIKLSDSWLAPKGYEPSYAEWLSSIFFYGIYQFGGWAGLLLLVKIADVVTLFAIYLKFRNANDLRYFLLALSIVAFFNSTFYVERSELFTFSLFAGYLFLREKKGWIWIFILPVWAALHGAYATFYPIFILDRIQQKNWKELWVVPFSLSLIALTMPHHLYNLEYPFIGLFAHYTKTVSEFRPVSAAHWTVFVNWGLMGLLVGIVWRQSKWKDKFIIAALLVMSLHIVRNEIFLSLYLLFVMPKESSLNCSWCQFPAVKQVRWFYFSVIVIFLFVYPTEGPFQTVDQQAIHALQQAHLYYQPGYYPRQYADYFASINHQFYLDGQGDVWSGTNGANETDLIDPFFAVESGTLPITKLPGYPKLRYLLTDNQSPVTYQAEMNSTWKLIYHDSKVTIFQREDKA